MSQTSIRRSSAIAVVTAALTGASFLANADDTLLFATGGYAQGLRTMDEMHKIDTDGDGLVSHEEFVTYQTRVFDVMDKSHSESLGPVEFLRR